MAALRAPDKLALSCRLRTAFAAGNPGVGLTELEPALGTLDNVSEFHLHESFF